MSTNQEILDAIDAAIIDILQNGQEVILKGTTYTKANVNTLFKMRDKYSSKANANDNFFSRSKTIIPGRGAY